MQYEHAPLAAAGRFLPEFTADTAAVGDRATRPRPVFRQETQTGLDFAILTRIPQIEAIAEEWRDLHARFGHDPFSGYDMVHAWWRTTGASDKRLRLHVVTCRTGGNLVAVLPLVVFRQRGLRILRGVGNNSERFCDIVCGDEHVIQQTWRWARKSRAYDFAICRGVFEGFPSMRVLQGFARERDKLEDHLLVCDWPSSKAWMASLTEKRRATFNRSFRQLDKKAPTRFEVHASGPVPADALDAMVATKRSWAAANNMESWIREPSAAPFFHESAKQAARNGQYFLTWLTCGDEKIAFLHGYRFQDTLYLELITYKQDWYKFSLGHLMVINTTKWAIDNGIKRIVHGPANVDTRAQGQNSFKVTYANATMAGTEFTFSATWRGRLLEASYFSARKFWRARQARKLARDGDR